MCPQQAHQIRPQSCCLLCMGLACATAFFQTLQSALHQN